MNLSEATIHKFGRFVPPLYRSENGVSLEFEGSGVLVWARNANWLFTAEHLFQNTSELFLSSANGNIRFPRSAFQGSSRLDVVFTQVRPEWTESIVAAGLTFFPGTLMEDCRKPPAPEECLFVGYPDRSITILHEMHRIEARTTSLRGTFLPRAEYQNFRLDKRIHVASRFFGFQEESPSGELLLDFNPKGLSGGAILRGRSPNLISLVGIATDFDPVKKVLFGSRFNELIPELLRLMRNKSSQ